MLTRPIVIYAKEWLDQSLPLSMRFAYTYMCQYGEVMASSGLEKGFAHGCDPYHFFVLGHFLGDKQTPKKTIGLSKSKPALNQNSLI